MPLDVLLQVNRALYNGYMRAAPQLLLNGSFVHPFEMVDIVPSNVSAQIFAAFVFQVIVNDRDVYARRTIAVYAPPDVHPFMLRLRGALLRRLNVKIFKYAEIPAEEFDVVFLAVRAANRKTEDRIQMNAILSRASSLCVICGAFEELGVSVLGKS